MSKTVLFFCLIFLIACIYISCKISSNSNPPPGPCAGVTVTVSGKITNASSGQNNGSIAASATGGSGFTYSLNNGAFQSSGTFSSLAQGNYTITAKNSNGCSGPKSFTVVAETACTGVNMVIDATATTAVTCGGPGATVMVNATGSTGLTYSINNGAFQAANTFTNVPAGNQTVVVKDANGCYAVKSSYCKCIQSRAFIYCRAQHSPGQLRELS